MNALAVGGKKRVGDEEGETGERGRRAQDVAYLYR